MSARELSSIWLVSGDAEADRRQLERMGFGGAMPVALPEVGAKGYCVPVGPTATTFVAKTGGCNSCHTGPSALGSVLHGLSDRRACFSCHASIPGEPDAALDIRVHMVHSRSERFASAGGNIRNCGLCHLAPPPGPLRNNGADGL